MGLLLPHKSTISIYPDMVSVSPSIEHKAAGGGPRGKIEVFSQESRYRLFRLLHQLTFERVTFATLTYPADFPTEAKIYKGHLKEYRRRFERLYGPVKAVWRLEFQERGAPHFHIMYLDAPFIPIHDWCWLWKCVCKSYDMAHELLGVDVKLVTGNSEKNLIASYLSKYVGKLDQSEVRNGSNKTGRYWGRWNIEESDPTKIEVRSWQAELIVAELLRSRGDGERWEPADRTMCTLFGNSLGSDRYSQRVRKIVDEVKRRGYSRVA